MTDGRKEMSLSFEFKVFVNSERQNIKEDLLEAATVCKNRFT